MTAKFRWLPAILLIAAFTNSTMLAQNRTREQRRLIHQRIQQQRQTGLIGQQPFRVFPAQNAGQPAPGVGGLAADTFQTKFDAEVQKHFDDKNLPGLVVLMARDGKLTYKKTLGFSDIANQTKANENHVFRLASVSKWVGAVLALKMEQQGEINLNAKVSSFLDDLPNHHTSRVIDTLSCRAGIRHYNEPTSPQSPTGWGNTVFENATDAAPNLWLDPLSVPDGVYHYSTHGYIFSAACLEQASGKSTPQLIRSKLSIPYGLSTLRTEDLDLNIATRVKLYDAVDSKDFSKGNVEIQRDNLTWKFLGGGLESSPMDLLKLGMKFCDRQIVSQAGIERMMKLIDEKSYTIGCNVAVENGNRVIAKNGGQPGISSYIWMVPDKQMVMVVLTNRQSGGASTLGKTLRNIALGTDNAGSSKPDLVVDQFERTGAPVYKNGKFEIPVRIRVRNQGNGGTSVQVVNGIQYGTSYRWSGFMQTIPPKGTRTANGVVKIPDPSKLLAGRTIELLAHADAPIAGADTSMPSYGRVDESNDGNNTKKLSVTFPGNGLGGLTTGTSNNNLPNTQGARDPQRVSSGGRTRPPRLGQVIRDRQTPRPTIVSPSIPQRRPSGGRPESAPTRVPTRPTSIGNADLEVSAIRFAIRQPQLAVAVVKNIGEGPARPSVLRLTVRKIGSVSVGRTKDFRVPSIAAGKSTSVNVDASSVLPNGVRLRSTTFRLDADNTKVVAEPDEANNLKWHRP